MGLLKVVPAAPAAEAELVILILAAMVDLMVEKEETPSTAKEQMVKAPAHVNSGR